MKLTNNTHFHPIPAQFLYLRLLEFKQTDVGIVIIKLMILGIYIDINLKEPEISKLPAVIPKFKNKKSFLLRKKSKGNYQNNFKKWEN